MTASRLAELLQDKGDLERWADEGGSSGGDPYLTLTRIEAQIARELERRERLERSRHRHRYARQLRAQGSHAPPVETEVSETQA